MESKTLKKLKKIQERALQYVYEDFDSSYEQLLEKSKLPALKTRRMKTIALETFKIINQKSPAFLNDLIVIKQNAYNFRYSKTADLPRPRTMR